MAEDSGEKKNGSLANEGRVMAARAAGKIREAATRQFMAEHGMVGSYASTDAARQVIVDGITALESIKHMIGIQAGHMAAATGQLGEGAALAANAGAGGISERATAAAAGSTATGQAILGAGNMLEDMIAALKSTVEGLDNRFRPAIARLVIQAANEGTANAGLSSELYMYSELMF